MKMTLLISLISLNSFAMDCDGIPEGQVFRIDQNNRSLSNASIQDQDGVPSCFGNQASLLLQSVMPGNPNLSYLNLALFYSSEQKKNQLKNNSADATRYTSDLISPDGSKTKDAASAITGGFACDTIKIALEKQRSSRQGSVCKAADVSLEHNFFNANANTFKDIDKMQEATLFQASKYMTIFQKTFGPPLDPNARMTWELKEKRQKADDFSNALKKFVENSSDAFFSSRCIDMTPKRVEAAINNAMIGVLDSNPKCINRKGGLSTDSSICKMIAQFGNLQTVSNGRSTRINFALSPRISHELTKSLPGILSKKEVFPEYMKGINEFLKKQDSLETTDNNIGAKNSFFKTLAQSFTSEDLRSVETQHKQVVMKDFGECKKENMLAYFRNKSQFLEQAKKDSVLCNYSELIHSAAELASIIPASTFNNMTSFVDFLTSKAGLNYDDAIMAIMAQDCTPDKRLKIPDSITCEGNPISFSPSDIAPNLSSVMKRTIKDHRRKFIFNLQSNRAVGIDICTKYWNDPRYDFHGDDPSTKMKNCQDSGIHGFHAITMIGYRCQNNKIQYLAQNSWGPNWSPGNGLEVENGKVWLDEDKLFKNLDRINYISPL